MPNGGLTFYTLNQPTVSSTYSVKVSPSLGINLVEKLKLTSRDNFSDPGGTYKLVMMVIDGIRPR